MRMIQGEAFIDGFIQPKDELIRISFNSEHIVTIIELDDDLLGFVEIRTTDGKYYLVKGEYRTITKQLDGV